MKNCYEIIIYIYSKIFSLFYDLDAYFFCHKLYKIIENKFFMSMLKIILSDTNFMIVKRS